MYDAKQKILHGRVPSNIKLAIFVALLMFAGLYNHCPPLTMCRLISVLNLPPYLLFKTTKPLKNSKQTIVLNSEKSVPFANGNFGKFIPEFLVE